MSDAVQQQAAPVKVAKQTKKASTTAKPKTAAAHPKYQAMVLEAIKKLAERTGSSKVAIVKWIVANYKLEEKSVNTHVKQSLRVGSKAGWLKQTKGTGASGSFRVGEVPKAVQPKVAKKPAAAKPKAAKTSKPKAPKASAKPKKNIKKVVKPSAPKPAAVTAPATPVAVAPKPAAPAKKPAAPKKIVKKAAPTKPALTKKAAPAKKAAPTKKASPAKKAAPAKKTAAK